jgi:hypothetical protein
MSVTGSVYYQVDQLLLEQGEYLPLELLLQEGRLSYADYEAWRNGELERLDQVLFGDPDHVRQQLVAAEQYLRDRGWCAEPVRYEVWPNPHAPTASESARKPLCFSSDPTLDTCFHRSYRKPPDQLQLDLFTDSPATCLVNGIIASIADRQPAEARRQLDRLFDVAPDHARLGELERLTEAAESLSRPVEDIAGELRQLQATLTPLAASVLGRTRYNLLVPLWRRLSRALQDQPYRAEQPELHASFTASQSLDWDEARHAVEREDNWRGDAVLLLRHATACDQQHDEAAALASWFALCWRFPQQTDALESSPSQTLRQNWSAFQDLDPELPVQLFPAWLLLRRPGLTKVLPESAADATTCPESYPTLYLLQRDQLDNAGISGNDAMALRARLKQQDPVLFQYFLDAQP